MELVKDNREHAVEGRVSLQSTHEHPSVTTSTRVAGDTFDSNLTLYPTVLPTGSFSIEAMRVAAARAASLLGSNTMTLPVRGSQAGLERIMARGSAVVLPAPGGA